MIATHSLASADFAALSAGRGDHWAIARLAAAQTSKGLLRLRLILDATQSLQPDLAGLVERAYDLLARAQEHNPVAAAQVITYPPVSAWSDLCLRRLRHIGWPAEDASHIIGNIAAVAASAAISAGVTFRIEVPARSGKVCLPALGCLYIPKARAEVEMAFGESGVAEVILGADVVELPRNLESDADGWHGLRRLRSVAGGFSWQVTIDDLDPYRGCYGFPVAGRLSPTEAAAWQQRVNDAWTILVQEHPWYAVAMQTGLNCLIPLQAGAAGRGISACSSNAFGACGLSFPADAQTLAATLVHEFQHAKLGALDDLIPLTAASPGQLYYSPWRDDPRPLRGLLHGAYAYLGVTDFWRIYHDGSDCTAFAGFQFARWREATRDAISMIEEGDMLTTAGLAFVAGMRSRLESWCLEPVAELSGVAARTAIDDHHIRWRLRNLRPDHGDIDRLAAAWLDAIAVTWKPSSPEMIMSGPALSHSRRIELLGLMLRDLEVGHSAEGPAEPGPGAVADFALARGNVAIAEEHYRKLIADDPDCADAWVGLALTRARTMMLFRRPELVYAVHQRIRELSETIPDPGDLADWLAGAECH